MNQKASVSFKSGERVDRYVHLIRYDKEWVPWTLCGKRVWFINLSHPKGQVCKECLKASEKQ